VRPRSTTRQQPQIGFGSRDGLRADECRDNGLLYLALREVEPPEFRSQVEPENEKNNQIQKNLKSKI
jgi:hypothetical protein